MAFTPAQLWECAEREAERRKRLHKLALESNPSGNFRRIELETEMMVEIAKILQDRAQGELPL